jgi:hypothetical protein
MMLPHLRDQTSDSVNDYLSTPANSVYGGGIRSNLSSESNLQYLTDQCNSGHADCLYTDMARVQRTQCQKIVGGHNYIELRIRMKEFLSKDFCFLFLFLNVP